MFTVSLNIFQHKLIYTCIDTRWISTSKVPFLCVFYKQLKRSNSKKKNVYTYLYRQNVFITLRKLYIETGDILICLLCVRLMAALGRLGAEKQEKMLGYFLCFSVRLYLFSPPLPSSGQFVLLQRHRLRIVERNVNNCLCAKIWTCRPEVRSTVAGSLVKPAPELKDICTCVIMPSTSFV